MSTRRRLARPLRAAVVRPLRAAFTLIEVLVVIVIIVIMLAIAVPAFNAMLSSQEAAGAEAQLGYGVSAARDLAARSSADQDAAAVFVYEPGGRLQIIACVVAGSFLDYDEVGDLERREIFVPSPLVEPVSLPLTWGVSAYAPLGTFGRQWYGPNTQGEFRYTPVDGAGAWVFPETGLFDHTATSGGMDRSTFMVRFKGGTGELVVSDPRLALVLLPRPTAAGRDAPPWDLYRADRATDLPRFVQQVLAGDPRRADPSNAQLVAQVRAADPRTLFGHDQPGRRSGDVVAVRPVQQLALYDMTRLTAAMGVSPDRITGSIYGVDPAAWVDGKQVSPRFVGPLATDAEAGQRIARWIEGYADLTGATGRPLGVTPPAKLFSIQRRSGALVPMGRPGTVAGSD